LCTGTGNVHQPPLFFHIFGAFVIARKNTVFKTGDNHIAELKPFCVVHGDKLHGIGSCIGFRKTAV